MADRDGENPFARNGPASPFLSGEPMLGARGLLRATPLVLLLAAAGGRIDGLRLLDGILIVGPVGLRRISSTYWYLEATPTLLRQIAQAAESAHMGRVSR